MRLPEWLDGRVTVSESGCWLWAGAKQTRGYGSLTNGAGGTQLAHRWVYQSMVGAIPAGLTIDHLCMVKACVNPEHLEPVTAGENVRRAGLVARARNTHCGKGHEFTAENTYIDPRGRRACRTCMRTRDRSRERLRPVMAVAA